MREDAAKVVMFGGTVTLTPADIHKGKGSLTAAVQRKINRRAVRVTIAEVVTKQDTGKSTLV